MRIFFLRIDAATIVHVICRLRFQITATTEAKMNALTDSPSKRLRLLLVSVIIQQPFYTIIEYHKFLSSVNSA
jgi:hypothetical protein